VWSATNVENLLRHKGGTYYARFRLPGKRKLFSLKTDVFSVAKLRLRDEAVKVERQRGTRAAVGSGAATMADLMKVYAERFETMDMAVGSKLGRHKAVKRILRTWPGFEALSPRAISADDVWKWASQLKTTGTGFAPPGSKGPAKKGAGASTVNQSISALQHLLDIAVEIGAVHQNVTRQKPPAGFGTLRKRAQPKPLHLPPHEVMQRLFDEIERPDPEVLARFREAQRAHRLDCGELCRFMAYSGARQGEAARAVWDDDRGTYLIVHGTKSAKSVDRSVTMNPALRELLNRVRRRREEAARFGAAPPQSSAPILRVQEAQITITRACRTLHATRLTHHDFRHLFTTRCLEVGVDPKTVAEWLGHSDGGVLVLRTYGHVRPDHAAASAAKVIF
jgi:integrase